MDATRPEPERPSPEPPREGELDCESGLRCPYCKAALTTGALAGACAACATLHHVACFAEHGGCSTHACGSTRARPLRVGDAVPPVLFKGLSCASCSKALPTEAVVARCDGCFGVLHAACYELLGTCLLGASGACRGSIELMSHAEVAAAQSRRQGVLLLVTGVLIFVGFGAFAAWLDWQASVYNAAAVAGLLIAFGGTAIIDGAAKTAKLGRTLRKVPSPPTTGDGAKDAP